MEENSQRMRAYAYIENILRKHINIKDKPTGTSWYLMIIRDSLRACAEIGRSCYGFEIKKDFVKQAKEKMLVEVKQPLF